MPAKLSEGRRKGYAHSLMAQGSMLAASDAGPGLNKLGLLDRNNMRGRMVTPIPDLGLRVLRAGDLRNFNVRASAAWYVANDGKLKAAPSGELRIGQGPSGALNYAVFEPASTNKCTGYNANPLEVIGTTATSAGSSITGVSVSTAGCTVTIVDDSAELALAGLDQVCTSGKVYQIDSTGAAGNCQINFSGAVGNTNQHTVSGYLRGNDVTARFGLNNAFTGLSNETASYTRFSGQVAAAGGGSSMSMLVAANKVSYVILMQCEELGSPTTPIVVAGSQVTRVADVCGLPLTLDGRAYVGHNEGVMFAIYEAPHVLGSGTAIVSIGEDGSNTVWFRLNTTNVVMVVRDAVAGNGDTAFGLATLVANSPVKQVFTWHWARGQCAVHASVGGVLGVLNRTSSFFAVFKPRFVFFGGLLGGAPGSTVYLKEVRFGKRAVSENEMVNLLVNP